MLSPISPMGISPNGCSGPALADVIGCQKRIVHMSRAVVGLPFKADADVMIIGGVMAP